MAGVDDVDDVNCCFSYYSSYSVLIALVMTVVVCTSIAVFTIQVRVSVNTETAGSAPHLLTSDPSTPLKAVEIYFGEGVFSAVSSIPFLPFFLPFPSFPINFPAQSGPSNPAKGFTGAPLTGRTTFAATRHVSWA